MIEHDQLHECARFLRPFPLSRALARAQPHDGTANADAFTGFQRNVAHEAIAFVEEAEHSDALRHWCHTGVRIHLALSNRSGPRLRQRSRLFRFGGRGALLTVATGQGKHTHRRNRGQRSHAQMWALCPRHALSGVHG